MKTKNPSPGLFLFALILIPIDAIIWGGTLMYLWNWFIVPVFNTVELTIYQAIGLNCLHNLLFLRVNDIKKEFLRDPIERALEKCIVGPLMCLAIGWIVISIIN